ncbi:MAG: guanine deaminase [Hyphomicrobiales bacterium]|jgi:tRNA(adenine34) deaminase|nr:guanine deaminase [Hyphomicrobiales bacterium]
MMCRCTRRTFVLASLGVVTATRACAANEFVAAAFRMKEDAIATGDQAFGAVVVRAGNIIGWGPSRVRELGEWVGHAERVAMRDAQRRTGRDDLSGCAMYSTSRPCGTCERAAAQAKLARMYHGPEATDAGAPR